MGGIIGIVGDADVKLIAKMLEAPQGGSADGTRRYSQGGAHIGISPPGADNSFDSTRRIFSNQYGQAAVCNGYISNRRELRSRLEGRGYNFKTPSDGETILYLYQEFGDSFVEFLDGDFALAVVDRDSVYLARDRFGVKPLYYILSVERGILLFASEIKALLQDDQVLSEIDENKMLDLIIPGYPVGNKTFLKGVMSVGPGNWLQVRRRGESLEVEEKQYFHLSYEPDYSLSIETATNRLVELLIDAVGSRLSEGSEMGLALSGGVDSTLIALTAHRYYSKRFTTFTIAGSSGDPDLNNARATSRLIKSEHQESIIEFEDYLRAIPRYVCLVERPPLQVGTPFYLLCVELAKKVKTCLIGEAADQMFGGGREYFVDKIMRERLLQGVSRAAELGLEVRDEVSAIVSDLCQARDYEQYVNNCFKRKLGDSFAIGLQFYNACSGAFGMEARDPFLNRDLVGFLKFVPANFKANREMMMDKYIFRRACLSMFGAEALDAVLRRKSGLGGSFSEYGKKFERMCDLGMSDDYMIAHPFKEYLPKKHQLILFDLFKLIFIDNRGQFPAHTDILSFINERGDPAQADRLRNFCRL